MKILVTIIAILAGLWLVSTAYFSPFDWFVKCVFSLMGVFLIAAGILGLVNGAY